MTVQTLIGGADACRILNVSRATLVRMIQREQLIPVSKMPSANGAYVFDRAEVEALAAEREA